MHHQSRFNALAALAAVVVCIVVVGACTREAQFDKAVARLRDIDSSLPFVDAGYIYYTRSDDEGRRLHCRRAIEAGSREEILFDSSSTFVGAYAVSPDSRWLAVSRETELDRWRIELRDLETGMSTLIEDADFSVAFGDDGTLFYAALDDDNTPRTVMSLQPAQRVHRVVMKGSDEVLVAPVDGKAAVFVLGAGSGRGAGGGAGTPKMRMLASPM